MLHAYAEEVERQTARLRHLGRLIARDRRPFCGVNGILLLIPMAATDNESDAHETGVCCQEDLATAREAMQVQCPVFALVCGLEQVPGFDAFISHFSPEQLRRRVGQRFPLVPDIAPDQVPAMIDGGVKWLGLNVFPSLALPHWRLEVPGVTDLGEAVRANAGLFHFLAEIRERQGWVSRILRRGVARETFGGCYFAATGRGSDRDQAFLRADVLSPARGAGFRLLGPGRPRRGGVVPPADPLGLRLAGRPGPRRGRVPRLAVLRLTPSDLPGRRDRGRRRGGPG